MPLPTLIIYRVVDDDHSGQFEMVSHCSFDLYSLMFSLEVTMKIQGQL